MRGLLIVGAGPEAGEPLAVAAACAAARRQGERPGALLAAAPGPAAARAIPLLVEATGQPADEVAPHAFPVEASPLVAGRHAGVALDPEDLVRRARSAAEGASLLVAGGGGGLLAPLTPRYAVRDLARDLALPVVVAARAAADLVSPVRLAIEAARGAGLAVAAVVLTGWPDPPGRVLLDERASLEELGGAPVVALADGPPRSAAELAEAVGDWPVAAWADAAGAPGAAPAPAEVVLEPYRAWEAREVGDPRATPRPRIMEVMLEIVGAEGPMTTTRAYSLYNRAAGGRKLTAVARAPLSSAVYWLARENRVVLTGKDEIPWQGDDLVRLPDAPAVRVRELGPRALEEVPLDEIAELVARLRSARGLSGATELKRAVLAAYGLVRLTARADEYLGLAVDLAS